MLDSEFSADFNEDKCVPPKNATIVGIYKHNKIRKMIIHHRTHR